MYFQEKKTFLKVTTIIISNIIAFYFYFSYKISFVTYKINKNIF
jgi:hypothetical protein